MRTALVTGASAGIGRATARMLAADGWRVIGVGRDPGRTAEAEAEIAAAARDGGSVAFLRGDFNEMRDVLRVAGEVKALTDRLDVLVNNAGGVRDALYRTSDGFEATFAANHLAPFLLTRELMPLLGAGSRVIAVSSSGHAASPGMKWADLNHFEDFATGAAYCQAKLANILFTRELARRVAGQGIVAQAMHPGRVASNFVSHADAAMQSHMASMDMITPDAPAKTIVWLATSAEGGEGSGRYFHDMAEEVPAPQGQDDAAAGRLWVETERMLAGAGYGSS